MASPTIADVPRRHPRSLGSFLCAAGVLVVMGATLGVPLVHAQGESDGPRPRAAVFDFDEADDWPGRLAGRRAAEAVHVALAEAGVWDLADRSVVINICADEGLEPPYGVGYLQMLGERLGTALAVTGRVEVCQVNPGRRAAQVTVVTELVETAEGSSLRSVRGVAAEQAQRGEVVTLEELVDRALVQVAGDVARALTNFEPTAARLVTTLPDGRVVLDAPQKPGLRPGDVLLVFAGDRPAGLLRVQSMKLTVVHAQVIGGEDFRGGQRAVLVAR